MLEQILSRLSVDTVRRIGNVTKLVRKQNQFDAAVAASLERLLNTPAIAKQIRKRMEKR